MPSAAATPLLDLDEPLPRRRSSSPAALAASVTLWCVVGFVGRRLVSPVVFHLDPMTAFALLAAALYAGVVVHECGHLVAGLAAGGRFVSLTVWPATIERAGGGVRVRRSRTSNLGLTVVLPAHPGNRRHAAAYALGGPVANLLLAAVGAAILAVSGRPPHVLPAGVACTAAVVAVVATSVMLGLINLVPFRKRATPSDGAIAVDALRANDRFRQREALVEAVAAFREGARAAALPPPLLAALTRPDDGSTFAMRGHLLTYAARAAEADRGAAAAPSLERALRATAYASRAERAMLAVEAVVYHGWYRGDAERTERWAAVARAEPQPVRQRARMDAAVAWVRGDVSKAVASLDDALRHAADLEPAPLRATFVAGTNEWIAKMRARADAASSATSPSATSG